MAMTAAAFDRATGFRDNLDLWGWTTCPECGERIPPAADETEGVHEKHARHCSYHPDHVSESEA